MIPAVSTAVRATVVATLACGLAACGHMPWQKSAPPAPESVSELLELATDGTVTQAFPQYWKRNTLVVDMQTAAASGTLILKPREGARWPARLAFRVTPGSIGVLEVRAAQRMLIPVTKEGTKPVDVELIPGVYTLASEQVTIQWGR